MANNLTQSELKKYLKYDPDTGIFTWLVDRNSYGGKTKAGSQAGHMSNQYLAIGLLGSRYYAHRLAFLYMKGNLPPDEVDHINHDRSDNRWENLRHADRKKNGRNLGLKSNNTSGVTGVHWSAAKKKWVAAIMVDGKTYMLGRADLFADAVKLRKDAERKYRFHKNHGK